MRSFATLMALLLPVFAGKPLRFWPLAASGIFLAIGAFAPQFLLRPYRLWMQLGHTLGIVNSRIILGALYFLVITPLGLLRRCFGDPMNKAWNPRLDSYRQTKKTPDLIQRMEVPY